MRNKFLAALIILFAHFGLNHAYAQHTMSGRGSPTSTTGDEGDWFLDLDSGKVWGPRTSNDWGNTTTGLSDWLTKLSAAQSPGGTWTFSNPLSVSASVPTISACGTTPPAVTAGSSNNSGQFTLGTDTPTACTVTFATAFTTTAFCTVTPASAAGAALTGGYYISAQDKTGFTLTIGTGTNSLVFNYTCMGN